MQKFSQFSTLSVQHDTSFTPRISFQKQPKPWIKPYEHKFIRQTNMQTLPIKKKKKKHIIVGKKNSLYLVQLARFNGTNDIVIQINTFYFFFLSCRRVFQDLFFNNASEKEAYKHRDRSLGNSLLDVRVQRENGKPQLLAGQDEKNTQIQ